MIKVLFFASTREALGVDALDVVMDRPVVTVGDILSELRSRGPSWEDALRDGRILHAVNHEMVSAGSRVEAGDEVAFFPPVTGG
jgi:molybdopterin synthase sulfur carrier subunit